MLEDAPARHGLSEVEASVEFESAARKATLIGVEVARNNAPQLISKQPNGQLVSLMEVFHHIMYWQALIFCYCTLITTLDS